MQIKKLLLAVILSLCGMVKADEDIGQVLQINTHFRKIEGKPTWLLIVRDEETGRVSPYLFDIRKQDNYWIALTYGHSYRVTVSQLTFKHFAIIDNFCGLRDGILSGISMYITLTGELSPHKKAYHYRIARYKDLNHS